MHICASGLTAPVEQALVDGSGLLTELQAALGYDGKPVPLSISMRDFAAWQRGPSRRHGSLRKALHAVKVRAKPLRLVGPCTCPAASAHGARG